jgi:hypothetical protein
MRVSQRFESIIHLARDKSDNTTHVSPKTSRVATVHDDDQIVERAHLTLLHVFHVIPHSGLFVGGPCTIPSIIQEV